MTLTEAIALKLIAEIKKPGRECLHDMNNSSCKNNHRKQNIWSAIADAVGIGRTECQAYWKSLRRRHRAAINKNAGRSGSECIKIKGFSKLLTNEMDYFVNFTEVKEPTATNSSRSNKQSFQSHFVETALDRDANESPIDCYELKSDHCSSSSSPLNKIDGRLKKRVKINKIEEEYRESIKTFNNLAAAVNKVSTEKRDPFFSALEEEFLKVPEDRKSSLKVKLISLVVESQN